MAAELFHSLPPSAQLAMLEGPAIPPPPGVEPSFDNPPNKREIGWIIISLCSTLSIAGIALRLYAKVVVFKRLKIEDCMTRNTDL